MAHPFRVDPRQFPLADCLAFRALASIKTAPISIPAPEVRLPSVRRVFAAPNMYSRPVVCPVGPPRILPFRFLEPQPKRSCLRRLLRTDPVPLRRSFPSVAGAHCPARQTNSSASQPGAVSCFRFAELATVRAGATQSFTATVTGSSNQAVSWQVNGTTGGSRLREPSAPRGSTLPPPAVPNPNTITITAVSAAQRKSTGTSSVTVVQSHSGHRQRESRDALAWARSRWP